METIPLGPFAVTPDGTLLPRAADAAPALDFAWRGRRCTARLGPDGVRIAADAARIPSTADAGANRRQAFDAVARLPGRLPAGWRAGLTPDHRIRVEASAPLRGPANATTLVAALVRFVLSLDPYLDGLEAEGAAWTPPAA
ncbi:hypothetical protein GWK16_11500 [Roseomonas sp. JC162]|uniref:Uncharacterized protein n=1 Tax=Neoroseomonas marina TaxID=1232220 RepID=A0A848EEB1_9PROT|nr:hypothetical protein [Neoroseomonas marina]NMJ41869.1 hypothetical protein [Neoroseomonas marina]